MDYFMNLTNHRITFNVDEVVSWLKSGDEVVFDSIVFKAKKKIDTYLITAIDKYYAYINLVSNTKFTDNLQDADVLIEHINSIRENRCNNMSNKEIVEEYVTNRYNVGEDRLLIALQDKPENLMEEENLAFYNSLPEQVVVYRGCDYDEVEECGVPLGISWTTELKVAEFFAYRWNNPNGCICKAVVPKSSIRYATNDRMEFEVMIIDVDDCDIISKGESDKFNIDEYHNYMDSIR